MIPVEYSLLTPLLEAYLICSYESFIRMDCSLRTSIPITVIALYAELSCFTHSAVTFDPILVHCLCSAADLEVWLEVQGLQFL